MGLFSLKISWDVARAFLMEAALMVLLPDLLYSGGYSNHNVSGPFCYFGIFSSLTAMMIKLVLMIDKVLSPSILLTNSCILTDFLQSWPAGWQKCMPSSQPGLDWRGLQFLRRFDQLCRLNS
jgi:hypothetical protein